MELNDGTSTQSVDQVVRLAVATVNGSTVVELIQADPAASTSTVLASQILTAAQLASNNQIEFQLSHVANTTAITGSFELLDNGTVNSTTTFGPTGTIFTNGVNWTRVAIDALTTPGVALNLGAGQSPLQMETLTAGATTNDSDATINYQWEESASPSFTTFTDIGTNSPTYVVQSSDLGSFIRVVATTSDPDNPQSATATSQVIGLLTWTNPVSGNWQTGSDWSGGVVPNSNDPTTIAASGSYVVTVSGSDAAYSLAVNDAGAIVAINSGGSLTLSGLLTVAAGSVELNSGGTIVGGTLVATGGTFGWAGGTLDGVTYWGPLNLSPASSSLFIKDGITLTGAGGSGKGTINLTGSSSTLYAVGTETLDNATLNIGNGSSSDYVYNDDISAAAVLTLGPNLTINQTGGNAYLYGYDDRTGSGIVNEGTINAGFNGGSFTINDVSFTNQGTINVSNGDSVTISPTSFSNAAGGLLSVNGGTLSITATGWTNGGVISESAGTLNLGGSLTLAQLGTVTHTGGILNITGTLDDTGTTLNVGSGTALGAVVLASNGTIKNGTIADAGSGLTFSGGTLDGVTYWGPLNLSPASSSLFIKDGITLTGAGGSGKGTINLTGSSSTLYAVGTETLDNATLNIGNGSSSDYVYNDDISAAAVLTLGPNLTINQTGGNAYLYGYDDRTGSGIVNEGTINAGFNGGSFTINDVSFTNQGTINVSNGDSVTISPTSFSNAAGGLLSVNGGTLSITATGWTNGGVISESTGTLNLGGSLTLAQLGTVTHTGGILNITGTLDDTGTTLNVGSGTALGAVVLASNGTIKNGTIADAGSGLTFSGGTLDGVTYWGPLNLSPASSSLFIKDGITLTGAGGSGKGTINLTGSSSTLYAVGTETLDNATLNIGNGSSSDYVYNDDISAAAVLTLGPNLTINQTGGNAYLYGYDDRTGSGIVNEGTINAGFNGGSFTINDVSFTNQGTINVSNGDSVTISPTSFSNAAGGLLSVNGGTLSITATGWTNGGVISESTGTLNLGGSLTLAQLGTVTHTGGILNITGTLDDTGTTLNVGSGTALGAVVLASNGTIKNGTIADAGSGLTFSGGTLDGVTYWGPLNLSPASSSLFIKDGITLTGAGGSGKGTINLTGSSSTLYAVGTETLDNATLNIGNGSSSDYVYNDDISAAAVLTLGPNLTINQTGGNAYLYGYDDRTGSGIVNEGTINAGFNGGSFTINDVSFTNQGTINVSNGDSVTISPTSFSNAAGGLLSVNGGTLSITATGWTNGGVISESTGTLNLGGSLTLAQLGTVTHTGGILNITGTLDDTGTTLNVGSGTALGAVVLASNGTIKNGTIADAGSGLTFSGGTLDGVTYWGPLNLSPASSSLFIKDGITLTGAGGSGKGTINLTGSSSTLYAVGTETLDNATLNIGNGSSTDYVYNDDISAAAVLTLGPNLTINQTGSNAYLYGYDDRTGSGIVNEGTINAGFNGGSFTINDVSFTNQGTINVSNGDGLLIQSSTFTNVSGGTLSGGTYVVSGGSTLTLPQNETISILAADVTLSGLGSAFRSFQTTGSHYTGLDTTLTSIASAGAFRLLGAISANEAQAVSDSGLLQLGGGSFGTSALAVTSTGSVSGFGTISAPLANSGSVNAQGGLLRITGAVTGSGADNIGSAATLEFDAATSGGQTVAFTATSGGLAIASPPNFGATISGFGVGNEIDLLKVVATSASYQSGILSVLNGATTVASLNLSGNYSGTTFDVSSDGNGGSLITIGSGPIISGDFWTSGVSGDWGTAANWNPSGVPNGTTAAAAISVPGNYTVTIAGNEDFTVGTLSINNPLATLNLAGTLSVTNSLSLQSGTLALSGTIIGGTIETYSGILSAAGGTLDGVTYWGPLNLSPASSSLFIKDGITLTGAGGSGKGTINLTGSSSTLYAVGTETLDNATLNIGNGSSSDYVYNDDISAAAVLTLGPNLTINQTGGNAYLYGYDDRTGSGIVNEGTINAGFNGGSFTINDVSFTNQGTINVSNGDSVTISPTSFSNAAGGLLSVNGGTLSITATGWTNGGVISESTGTLNLGGSLTLAQLGTVTHTGGILNITGTLDDTGTTLNVGSGTALGAVVLASNGTIKNGTIADAGSGLTFSGGTLDGVTYWGPLNLSPASSSLFIKDGITLTGAGGSGKGTINLTGSSSTLYAVGTETLDNATLNIGNGSSSDYVYNDDISAAAVLTLGPNLTINQTGGNAYLYGYDDRTGSGIVNEGTINAGFNGGSFTINDVSFTNQGTINVSNGDSVTISPTSFSNAAGGLLSVNGGTLSITATGWTNGGVISESTGTLNLGGSLTLAQLGTVTHTGGILNITGTLDDTGTTLNVGSGTALGAVVLASNGTIKNGTIADAGSGLTFSGGTLDGVTYWGPLNLSPASSSLFIKDGITLTGAGGSGKGTINLTGSSSTLYAVGTETLDNATLNIGNGSSSDYVYNDDISAAAVLTLGPNLTINQTGGNAYLYGYDDRTGSGIVNEGTINAGFNGGSFTINDVSFTNQGTINVSNGDSVTISPTSFSNAAGGLLSVNGGTLSITATGWTNGGVISESTGTLNLGGSLTLAQLGTVTHTGGILNITGTLDDTGTTLNVGSGTALGAVVLASNGTIKNGTIADAGSGLTFSGGTLDGVTYWGPLNLSPASSSLFIKDGITLTGAGGSGKGTINLTGSSSTLYAVGTETLDNATLNIGNGSSSDYVYNDDISAAAVLTLGPNLTINQTGGNAYLYGYDDRTGSGIVNEGTINAGFNGGSFTINDVSFTNQGTINVSNGDSVTISPTSFSNAAGGLLSVNGGTLSITATGWTNGGVISESTGTLNLGGSLTLAQLGTVTHTGGILNITGTLDDTGTTLNVGSGTALGAVVLASNGTIKNGTIADAGSGLTFSGGTLDGVTYWGPLNLSPASSSLFIKDGITLTGAGGSGKGTINLTGSSSTLYAVGTETLDNATLNIGNGSSSDYVYNDDISAAAVLTLGPNLTINQTGGNAYLYGYDDRTGSGIVNEGTINAGFNGGSFTINDVSFTNQGTINVSNGDTLDVASPEAGTGSYTINAGSTFEFAGSVAAGATVTFGASTGTLLLLSPSTFSTGTVISATAGALGIGDVLDLRGFASGSDTITASTVNGYNSSTGDTTLTVTDTTTGHGLTVQLTLAGNYYASSSWLVTSDGHGGFDIYDPPLAAATSSGAAARSGTLANITGTTGNFAGVAGAPINVALSNPARGNGQSVTVTVTGLPSDWQLNQGRNLGNGTWETETSDLTALTVLTGAAYAGALLLGVTESWANADGSTASLSLSDTVAASAAGLPIFAGPGDDTLTGAGANDLFVFAQPTGNDVIYNFNVASDKIDLVGFDGVSSFADIQLADDANGNAVISLGSGETITLHGIDATLLTANNFEFDQTPVTDNAGDSGDQRWRHAAVNRHHRQFRHDRTELNRRCNSSCRSLATASRLRAVARSSCPTAR